MHQDVCVSLLPSDRACAEWYNVYNTTSHSYTRATHVNVVSEFNEYYFFFHNARKISLHSLF